MAKPKVDQDANMGTEHMHDTLDEVSSGALTPDEAFTSLRSFLAKHKGRGPSERVYEATRAIVWQLVSSRESGDHVLRWQNVLLKIRQIVRKSDEGVAERFTVLVDFLAQTARFREVHAPAEVRQRKHVVQILKILMEARAPVDRKVLAQLTGLKAANLSRVISNLAAEGWLQRRYVGREIEVVITGDGRKVYHECIGHVPAPTVRTLDVDVFAGGAWECWPRDLCSLAVSNDRHLVFWHDEFLSLFPDKKKQDPRSWGIDELRRNITKATETSDEVVPEEVVGSNGRTYRVVERDAKNGFSLWLSLDITEYRKRLDTYERRERALKSEIDILRRRYSHTKREAGFGFVDDPLQVIAIVRRDVIAPLNAICSLAYALKEGSLPGLSWQGAEKVSDIVSFAYKVRDVARTVVKIGEANAHALLNVDRFTPDEVLRGVIDSLSNTLRYSDVVVRQTNKIIEPVYGDEIAMRTALTTTLAGITAAGRPISISVKPKLTPSGLEYDVFCPVGERDFDGSDVIATSMLSCEAPIRKLGLGFRFNSSQKGYNACIVTPFGPERSGTAEY